MLTHEWHTNTKDFDTGNYYFLEGKSDKGKPVKAAGHFATH